MTDFMYEGFLTSSDCAQVHNDPVQFQITTQHTGESGELVEFANPDIQIAIRIPGIIPYGTNAGFPVSYTPIRYPRNPLPCLIRLFERR